MVLKKAFLKSGLAQYSKVIKMLQMIMCSNRVVLLVN